MPVCYCLRAAALSSISLLQSPDSCTTAQLTRSAIYKGAALRSCSLDEAAPFLPGIARLIADTPQLVTFANSLKLSQLTSIPGKEVTSTWGADWSCFAHSGTPA